MTDKTGVILISIFCLLTGFLVGNLLGNQVTEHNFKAKLISRLIQHKCAEYNAKSGKLVWLDNTLVFKGE